VLTAYFLFAAGENVCKNKTDFKKPVTERMEIRQKANISDIADSSPLRLTA